MSISKGAVASILHVQQTPWNKALTMGIGTSIQKELKFVLNHFLVFHLERHLKATRFLA